MATSFNTLRKKMGPKRREANAARARAIIAAMPLQQVRQARRLSQQRIAELMGTTQGEVSKIEHRTDAYISTVRSYIEAMGGTLDLVAHLPDGDYRITQFGAIDAEEIVS